MSYDFLWICYQNWLCPWFLKNILLPLRIVARRWKFFNNCEIVHNSTIDYIEYSRWNNVIQQNDA